MSFRPRIEASSVGQPWVGIPQQNPMINADSEVKFFGGN